MTSRVAVVMPTYVTEAWQLAMTRAAVETLRVTADLPFDLVVANRPGKFERELTAIFMKAEAHVVETPGRSVNHDTNLGFDRAQELGADLVVYTGNDVFTRPGWLGGLLACFDHDPLCQVATLMPAENRAGLGPRRGIDEGVYGPFMMFSSAHRFDADEFPGVFGDTDLVMRLYREGGRAFRNNDHVVHHFLHQTAIFGPEEFAAARERFVARHYGSGLVIFRLLAQGTVF